MNHTPSAVLRAWSRTALRRTVGLLAVAMLSACPNDSGTDPFEFEYNADGTPGTTSFHRQGGYTVQGADITFRWGSNPPGTYLGRMQRGVVTIPLDFMGKGVSAAYAFGSKP